MKGKAYLYRPYQGKPEVIELTAAPSLEYLQESVGGYIEVVPGFVLFVEDDERVPCVAYSNEEGKLKGLPINNAATIAWDQALRRLRDDRYRRIYPTGLMQSDGTASDFLVGPVLVITGDAELMAKV